MPSEKEEEFIKIFEDAKSGKSKSYQTWYESFSLKKDLFSYRFPAITETSHIIEEQVLLYEKQMEKLIENIGLAFKTKIGVYFLVGEYGSGKSHLLLRIKNILDKKTKNEIHYLTLFDLELIEIHNFNPTILMIDEGEALITLKNRVIMDKLNELILRPDTPNLIVFSITPQAYSYIQRFNEMESNINSKLKNFRLLRENQTASRTISLKSSKLQLLRFLDYLISKNLKSTTSIDSIIDPKVLFNIALKSTTPRGCIELLRLTFNEAWRSEINYITNAFWEKKFSRAPYGFLTLLGENQDNWETLEVPKYTEVVLNGIISYMNTYKEETITTNDIYKYILKQRINIGRSTVRRVLEDFLELKLIEREKEISDDKRLVKYNLLLNKIESYQSFLSLKSILNHYYKYSVKNFFLNELFESYLKEDFKTIKNKKFLNIQYKNYSLMPFFLRNIFRNKEIDHSFENLSKLLKSSYILAHNGNKDETKFYNYLILQEETKKPIWKEDINTIFFNMSKDDVKTLHKEIKIRDVEVIFSDCSFLHELSKTERINAIKILIEVLKLLTTKGYTGLILPDNILLSKWAKTFRSCLTRHFRILKIYYVNNLSYDIADFNPVLIFFKKDKPMKSRFIEVINIKQKDNNYVISNKYNVPQERFQNNEEYILDIHLNQHHVGLMEKLKKFSPHNLGSSFKIKRGILVSDKGKFNRLSSEFGKKIFIEKKKTFKFVSGRKILPYHYIEPEEISIERSQFSEALNELLNPKIITPRILDRNRFYYDQGKELLIDHNCLALIPLEKTNPEILKFTLGFLNSSICLFFLKGRDRDIRSVVGSKWQNLAIKDLYNLPIPDKTLNPRLYNRVVDSVTERIDLEKTDQKVERKEIRRYELDDKINCLFYDLYHLSERDISILNSFIVKYKTEEDIIRIVFNKPELINSKLLNNWKKKQEVKLPIRNRKVDILFEKEDEKVIVEVKKGKISTVHVHQLISFQKDLVKLREKEMIELYVLGMDIDKTDLSRLNENNIQFISYSDFLAENPKARL